MYNTSELKLSWEEKTPVTLAPELHLTEYGLLNMWTNVTTINADLSDLRHGAFSKETLMKPKRIHFQLYYIFYSFTSQFFQPETTVL